MLRLYPIPPDRESALTPRHRPYYARGVNGATVSDEPNIEAIEAALVASRSHVYRLTGPLSGVQRIEVAFDDEPPAVFVRVQDTPALRADARAVDVDPRLPYIRTLLAEVRRLTVERDRWREYCEGARESVATLTRERDAARNALAAVGVVIGSGS